MMTVTVIAHSTATTVFSFSTTCSPSGEFRKRRASTVSGDNRIEVDFNGASSITALSLAVATIATG